MKQQGTIFAKIIIPVVSFLVVAYLIISASIGLQNPYTLLVVYSDVLEKSERTSGWIVREEQLIQGGEGLLQRQAAQGDRVHKNQVLAMLYPSEDYVKQQDELSETSTALAALQYATYEASPTGVTLEELTLSSMTDLHAAAANGSYADLTSKAEQYRKLVLRREYLVSGQAAAEIAATANTLYNQYNALQAGQTGASAITAPQSGTFSLSTDGYETLLSPAKLKGLTVGELADFSQLAPLSSNNTLGKLVTSTTWYYAATLSQEYADTLSIGSKVSLSFDSLPQPISMEVSAIGEVQDGKTVLIFTSSQSEAAVCDLRQESCRVVFESDAGIRIPKEALRVDENGGAVVYVASGYVAKCRPVKILSETDSDYLVAPDPKNEEDKRILQSGDELILASSDLYDGKVIR